MKPWKMAILSCFPTNENWIGGKQVKTHLCATIQNAHILQSFHVMHENLQISTKNGAMIQKFDMVLV